jgi:cell division septal protein FtsQ
MPAEVPVVAKADRRFRRAKVKPVRPARRGRGPDRILRVVRAAGLAVLALYGTYRAVATLMGTPLLQVEHIVIRGNERLSKGEILGVLQGLQGSSIVRARLGIWRRRLLTSPWVRDAALRRVLPSTIEVAISEREPVGLARLGAQLYLVDRDGTIIDEYGAQHEAFDLPIIDGLATAPPGGSPAIDVGRVTLARRLLESVARDSGLVQRLSQIDVRDPHNAIVLLDGDPALIHLGEDQFLERLRDYVELSGALHERVAQIDYVDLRFGERVYVRPAGARSGRDAAAASRQVDR